MYNPMNRPIYIVLFDPHYSNHMSANLYLKPLFTIMRDYYPDTLAIYNESVNIMDHFSIIQGQQKPKTFTLQ